MKKIISYVLKFGVVLTSFAGVIIGFFQAQLDGYSAWYKRLYFFTTQSNLWIGVTMLLITIFSFIYKNQGVIKDRLYLLKFIFNENNENNWDDVEDEIKEAVAKYVPNASINEINAVRDENDDNAVYIDVQYSIKRGLSTENNRMVIKL